METAILIVIALAAGAYIYYSLFKKGSCNCGSKGCCSNQKNEK
jgi:hypothetical protein